MTGAMMDLPGSHEKKSGVQVGVDPQLVRPVYGAGADGEDDGAGANEAHGVQRRYAGEDEQEGRIGRLAGLDIEELVYHANLQRISYGMQDQKHRWFRFFNNPFGPDVPQNTLRYPIDPSNSSDDGSKERRRAEWKDEVSASKKEARRALRTASWGMMFYLITTDVIGPFNAPYAISTVGFAGGVLLYATFGIAALYSSFIVLNLYLRLDSDRHPIRSYGDLMEVFFGKVGHYLVSVIQVVQIIFIVASNIIANAQGMTQLTAPNGSLCFIASIVIWTVIGLVTSIPFRSLAKLSYLATFNVFINLLIIFMSMGFIAHSPPNYESAAAAYGFTAPYGPVHTPATSGKDLPTQVNGAMNMVFGWSGLMIFIEFMNEMRRPYEFVKSFCFAEALVFVVYIMYGSYVYGFQGQYTLPVAFQGVSNYTWQSIGNGLSLWTYNMASTTYLNIAVKVVYWFLFEEVWRGPDLMSGRGFVYWAILQTCAWWISFIIGTAIPQVQTIQGLVAAAFLLQFSYSWPPLMQLAYDVHADASRMDDVYSPELTLGAGRGYKAGSVVEGGPGMGAVGAVGERGTKGRVRRYDTWHSPARWRRGLLSGRVWFKGVNLVYFLAALATSGLGIYGSALSIQDTFQTSQATSFGCAAPV